MSMHMITSHLYRGNNDDDLRTAIGSGRVAEETDSESATTDRIISWLCITFIGFTVGTLAIIGVRIVGLGPLSSHMAEHIALMNIIAPALAIGVLGLAQFRPASVSTIFIATFVQILTLWAWHLPTPLGLAMSEPSLHLLMSISLFAVAMWFWLLVLNERYNRSWRAIFAVLISGKLFCLLGAILIFAPGVLYPCLSATCGPSTDPLLADQQLAGLLMITACPLTFVAAGIIFAARWLSDMSRTPRALPIGSSVLPIAGGG